MFLIVADESLNARKKLPQPCSIATVLLSDEGGMLGDDGLVHVGRIDILWLHLGRVALGIDHHRHVTVFQRCVCQVIQHATLFISQCLATVGVCSCIGKYLSKCNI